MKTLKNITIKQPNGEPQIDALTKKELNTANLIEIMLGQSKFDPVSQQWMAYEITKKLKSGEDVILEDAEYELVKSKAEAFGPYLTGFTFIPFMELFKD